MCCLLVRNGRGMGQSFREPIWQSRRNNFGLNPARGGSTRGRARPRRRARYPFLTLGAAWFELPSSLPWRSPHWRESFAPSASRTAHCRFLGSKVFPAQRRRSGIPHLGLYHALQECSDCRTHPPVKAYFHQQFRTLLPRTLEALLVRVVSLPAKSRFLVRSER